ncbi:hypothetical protein, partial [Salmonella sp. M29]|uniref:hypothetical protein n=1 Tax=Salmonella sp. M29 TaxID=3240307 RepID=UPI00352A7BB2
MTKHFPFQDQAPLSTITQEQIDAFNMERFRFAKEFPGKAVGVSPFEALHEASLKLLEAAMGEKERKIPVI